MFTWKHLDETVSLDATSAKQSKTKTATPAAQTAIEWQPFSSSSPVEYTFLVVVFTVQNLAENARQCAVKYGYSRIKNDKNNNNNTAPMSRVDRQANTDASFSVRLQRSMCEGDSSIYSTFERSQYL